MDLRTTKQIIYGTFYLIIWGIIIFAGYRIFFYAPPSCFDHIQNEGETGVDCGGPCAAACIPENLNTITPLAAPSVFVAAPGHYTVLGQVENANPGFAAHGFDYAFTLYDASGTVLATIPGHSFMYASEVKYLVAPNVMIATDTVDHAALTIGDIDWIPGTTLGVVPDWGPQKEPQIIGSSANSSTVTVDGELTDDDVSAFNNILIVAIFKDASGDPIGASQTEIDSIAPNQTQTFSVIYPVSPTVAPALTTLYAYALRL